MFFIEINYLNYKNYFQKLWLVVGLGTTIFFCTFQHMAGERKVGWSFIGYEPMEHVVYVDLCLIHQPKMKTNPKIRSHPSYLFQWFLFSKFHQTALKIKIVSKLLPYGFIEKWLVL